jgi:hypothetical protein
MSASASAHLSEGGYADVKHSDARIPEPSPAISEVLTAEKEQNIEISAGASSPSAPVLVRRRTAGASAEFLREDREDGSKRRKKNTVSFRDLFLSVTTLVTPERRVGEEPTVRESLWAIVRCSCVFLVYHPPKYSN